MRLLQLVLDVDVFGVCTFEAGLVVRVERHVS